MALPPPFSPSIASSCVVFLVSIAYTQGRESSQDEIGSSALLAKSMDDDLDDAAVQVNRCQTTATLHRRKNRPQEFHV